MLQLIHGRAVCTDLCSVHNSTLSALEQKEKTVLDQGLHFRSKAKEELRNLASLQSFSEHLSAGWGLCIHHKVTGGTVTKTGWFWASRFNCHSAVCVSIHVIIQAPGSVCVCTCGMLQVAEAA